MLAKQVIVRDARPEDVEELTSLMTDLGYPTTLEEFKVRFENISAHPDYRTIVAVANGEMVGMAGLSKNIFYEMNGNYMRILAFVVKKNSRKLGVGKILIEVAESWAREQELHTVVISSGNRAERDAAHVFYQKMGYAIKSSGFVKKL
jgi:GNAT superfamily N-acetyltransferase